MDIRTLTSDDMERVHEINEGQVPAVGSETVDKLTEIFDESVIALAAVEGDTVGGFCLVLPPDARYDSKNFGWFRDRLDDFLYLDRVAFAPEFQRLGGGAQMYRRVFEEAKLVRPSATELALEVNLVPRNDASLAFHDRLGFVEVGVRTPSPDYSVSMMTTSLVGR